MSQYPDGNLCAMAKVEEEAIGAFVGDAVLKKTRMLRLSGSLNCSVSRFVFAAIQTIPIDEFKN